MQDEIEFATATGRDGKRLDIVINSVRDRGLDDFPEDEFVGPSFIAARWGGPLEVTSWDSFGNLEATPPVTVDGVEYPFGKIYDLFVAELIEAFSGSLPDGTVPHYVDNWDVYHLALGEVRCGTNVLRTPTEDWWTAALPLLENDR